MHKITVIVADDHRLIRQGIKMLLSEVEDIELIAEAENGEELIKLVEKNIPDVILLDVNMPKMDGITAMGIILKKFPETGIIMLSIQANPEFVLKTVQAGALSFLLKNVNKEELESTIKKVAYGEKFFNNEVNELLIKGQQEIRKQKNDAIKITKREKEILECISKGMTTKQIAEALFLSQRTIETHRLNLLKKFKAQNSTEMLKMAIKRQIISV